MICPMKVSVNQDRGYLEYECVYDCAWWDSKANFNPETKQFEGQCCILTLSRLKISGGISTHPY